MMPLFKDAGLQASFDEKGYVKTSVLEQSAVDVIRKHLRDLNLADESGVGFKVSQCSKDPDFRKRCQEYLVAEVWPVLERLLVDRSACIATFMVKEPDAFVLTAHQDASCCDETRHDSVACWIPLDDVDRENAAIGFIDGSHRFFDHLRHFPYHTRGRREPDPQRAVLETPVHRHSLKITPYLKLLQMQAGDAVFFNTRTVHGSFSNYTKVPRVALNFFLRPVNDRFLCYYLKPNGLADTLLEYEIPADFYVDNNNMTMTEQYLRGNLLEGYRYRELPYRIESMEWEELRDRIVSSGHEKDPWKVAKTEEFFGLTISE